jgi:hypothetical protein
MVNEDKLRSDIARATQAKHLVDSELLQEAFTGLEDAYVRAWRDTTIHDVNAREKLFLAINVVGKVKDHLSSIVANGNLAKKELEDLARVAEPRKRFGVI